jgi:pseudomonalisin
MGPSVRLRAAASIAVVTWALAVVPARAAPPWAPTETRAHPVRGATFRGLLSDDELLDIAVVLRVRDPEGLGALVRALSTPGSPAFRRWLDPDRVRAAYAPTNAQAQRVVAWLTRAGFSAVQLEPGGMRVSATGSARVIRSALATELAHFTRDGRDGIANTADVQVPAELGDAVLAVLGLQTLDGMHALNRRADASLGPLFTGVQGLSPVAFPIAYDAAGLPTASTVSVGILAEGDLTQTLADLSQFESGHGLPAISPVVVRVGRGSHDTSNTNEWDIDSQNIQAMAGGNVAQLVFYDAHSLSDSDINLALGQAVTDDTVAVLNVSLGECESVAVSDGSMAANDQLFAMAVAQGQTISVASGDFGAQECGNPPGTAAGASYPASSPYVIAVGGTTLSTNGSGGYVGETVWGLAGGSPSLYESAPAWQSGIATGGFRAVPDVAFDGDPNSGSIVIVNGQPAQYGGTSLASPIFVGAWARIQTANGAALGFPAAWIYARGALGTPAFHDVLIGSNGFGAGPGWDFASGWGSFDVAAVALLTRSSVVVSASPPTIVPGQEAILTATVTANTPTGTVQFLVDGSPLGAPVLVVGGVATLSTTSFATVGLFAISATYSGDGNDAGSTSASPFIETVAPPIPVPALPAHLALLLSCALCAIALARRA